MTILSTLAAAVEAALILEGLLAIARRLKFFGDWKVQAGDTTVWIMRFALAQIARSTVVEYAGPYLSYWVGLCGWVAFSVAWLLTVWVQRQVAGRIGLRRRVESPTPPNNSLDRTQDA